MFQIQSHTIINLWETCFRTNKKFSEVFTVYMAYKISQFCISRKYVGNLFRNRFCKLPSWSSPTDFPHTLAFRFSGDTTREKSHIFLCSAVHICSIKNGISCVIVMRVIRVIIKTYTHMYTYMYSTCTIM